ncbi:MAG: hypothetical protein GWP10_11235, partial [Nitrospiraceae bacterium]|nr:hypothetical protein [Nitrospiraceae bacterium]
MLLRTYYKTVEFLLALSLLLIGILAIVPAPVAQATEGTTAQWKIEKWSEKKWTTSGGTITYHVKVTRLGPPVSGAAIMDYRDTSVTSAYGTISPPPESGGGMSTSVRWNVDMNTGDSWTATYQVNVNFGLTDGTTIANSFEIGWPSTEVMVNYYVQVGQGSSNPTAGANAAAQTTSDPIDTGTGEHYAGPILDFYLGGPLPLTFSRYYAAGLHDEGLVASSLGDNWMHNFDFNLRRLAPTWNRRVVVYERGKLIHFDYGYPGVSLERNFRQEPIPYILEEDGAGHYWLLDPIRQRLYRFDAAGLLQEIRDRNGNRLTVSRDGNDRITQVTDGLGRTLIFSYSGDRLIRVSDGSRHVDYTYDGDSRLATAADAEGNVTTYTYDADATHGPLLTAQARPVGNTPYVQTYDAGGAVVRQTDAYNNATTIERDTPAAGQTRVTRADNSRVVFTHEDQRLGTAVQDPAGHSYTLDFDYRERTTALHDRLGDTTQIAYHDESGQIASYTDAEGHTTTFTYTAQTQAFTNPIAPSKIVTFTFYNQTRAAYADGTHDDFAYDPHGNVTSHTDRRGQVWTYTYNSRGQVLTVTNPRGGATTYSYNADATLATSADSDLGLTTYGYDPYKRLITITRPGGATVHFTYDLNNRLLTLTDELGRVTAFTYDANGNLDSASNPLGQTTTYAQDLMDRLTARTDPLGHSSARTYDEMGRP